MHPERFGASEVPDIESDKRCLRRNRRLQNLLVVGVGKRWANPEVNRHVDNAPCQRPHDQDSFGLVNSTNRDLAIQHIPVL